MTDAINKIYVGQSNIRIYVSTGADITGYNTVQIEVRQPSNSTTSWTATVNNASTGSLYYDVPTSTTLVSEGVYLLQPYIGFTDSTTSYGTTTEMRVYPLFS